jgi:hypothetical protein
LNSLINFYLDLLVINIEAQNSTKDQDKVEKDQEEGLKKEEEGMKREKLLDGRSFNRETVKEYEVFILKLIDWDLARIIVPFNFIQLYLSHGVLFSSDKSIS